MGQKSIFRSIGVIFLISFLVTPSFTSEAQGHPQLVTFVKSVFSLPASGSVNSQQSLAGVVPWGDKFIYTGDRYLSDPYGGLWVANQDGTNLISREPHIDAGATYSSILQHANARANSIFADWSGGGFLRENHSWDSTANSFELVGSGANKAVFYSLDGSGLYASGKSQTEGEGNKGFIMLSGKALNYETNKLYKLPDLSVIKSVNVPSSLYGGLGYYDFVIDKQNAVAWRYSETSGFTKVKDLVDRPSGVQLGANYAFDFSATPAKLLVYSSYDEGGWMYKKGRNLRIYKISGDTLILEKEYKFGDCNVMSSLYSCAPDFPVPLFGLAAWGDYVVSGSYSGFTVWKKGISALEKVQEVSLSAKRIYGDSIHAPQNIVANKNGYLAITFNQSMESFIYKINANLPISSTDPNNPTNPSPSGPNPYVPGSSYCAQKYPNNVSLRSLCEQIESLKAQACRLSPSLSFCAR